jgi:hypothetical protein
MPRLLDSARDRWAELTELDWGGGGGVLESCFPHWDGEGGECNIWSFEGIEHWPGLRSIDIDLSEVIHLEPLTALPVLEILRMPGYGPVDRSPLERIPTLHTIDIDTY